mmetsp:Transcript_68941/g.191972  ORF Transcript_68941/g.191972 Transcript_68941/m.191972 type:complete len:222 (+) Transcript_68941:1213-1878(+)
MLLARTLRATTSRSERRPASIMETSSSTRTSVSIHRCTTSELASTRARIVSSGSLPRPMPANAWTVPPPRFAAARPVVAVTATTFVFRSSWTTYANKKLFPVPASPVRNKLFPQRASCAHLSCSWFNCDASISGAACSSASAAPFLGDGAPGASPLAPRFLPAWRAQTAMICSPYILALAAPKPGIPARAFMSSGQASATAAKALSEKTFSIDMRCILSLL